MVSCDSICSIYLQQDQRETYSGLAMAGNSTKVVEFFIGSMHMKAMLVEEAPDEETLCYVCESPVQGFPFYTTEPHIFDVHLTCAENCSFFIHGQEKSSSPAPGNHRHYNHDRQLAGFQYPWQPQPYVNPYGYAAQPMNFSYHPAPFYPPSYPQPLNHYLYPYYPQPPNSFLPPPVPVSQSYAYRPPANGSINQHAGNEVWRPTNSGILSAAGMLGKAAFAAFLQALFGSFMPF